jgi:hypothetical protein
MRHVWNRVILRLLLLGCVLPNGQLFAQDLIVKNDGDSIFCKINTIAPLYLTYAYTNQHKTIKKTIPLKEVKVYLLNAFKADSAGLAAANPATDKHLSSGFFLSGGYGLGMLNGPQPQNLPPALDDYLNELRSGKAFHANVGYFPKKTIGIGVHFSRFRTTNEENIILVTNSQGTMLSKLSDDIRIRYTALCLQAKLGEVTQVFSLNSSFGVGYSSYYNEAFLIEPFIIKSASLGTHAYLWLEVNFNTHIALTAGGGLFFTKFSEFEIDYYTRGSKSIYTPNEPDNNNRYDLFGGVRYKF